MKQSAVEFLVELLNNINNDFNSSFKEEIEQVKEMEKQQIIDFTSDFIDKHTFGDYDGIVQRNKTIQEYYKETFKTK